MIAKIVIINNGIALKFVKYGTPDVSYYNYMIKPIVFLNESTNK